MASSYLAKPQWVLSINKRDMNLKVDDLVSSSRIICQVHKHVMS